MKVQNYKGKENIFIEKLIDRINELESRERIVIKFPFSSKFNRIEIYASETFTTNNAASEALYGEKFDYVVKYSVFNDMGNKPSHISSYSYKKEFINFIIKIYPKFFEV